MGMRVRGEEPEKEEEIEEIQHHSVGELKRKGEWCVLTLTQL